MGAAFWMNAVAGGTLAGRGRIRVLLVMLFGWFGTVIGESEARLYNKKVDASFRWSMSWFIFSEVMFFFAFFGALFYIRASLGARPRQPDVEARLARLHRRLADERPLHQRAVHADGRDRDPAPQYDHPAVRPASRSPSRITRSEPATAGRSSSGSSRPSCWASRSWASRRTNTSTPTARSTSSCRRASTARRSSCSRGSTART